MGMGPNDGGFLDLGGFERRRLRHKIENLERKVKDLDHYNDELIKRERAINHARAVITDEPRWDYSDPDKDNFEAYLKGEKFFNEQDLKKSINWCLKFEKLIKAVAYAHYFSFGEKKEDRHRDWYTKLELREINAAGFRFAVFECIDDQVSLKEERGHYFLPMEFLWTDWAKRCEEKKAELDAKRAVKQAEAKAKQEAYWAKKDEERYLQAKKLVEERERGK
jgi:hypothetical protein